MPVTRISAEQIIAWSQQETADRDLPRLLRKLLWSDAQPGDSLEFRAGKGTHLGGWDGVVQSSSGSRMTPPGVSGWELSVRADVKQKADEDFESRRASASTTTSFVAVTGRRWPGKEAWATEKRQLGIWSEVRVVDADDLEAWLDEAPSVAVWFAERLGLPTDGLESIEEFLHRWSRRTQPALPPKVLLGRRGLAVQQVLQWVEDASSILRVHADHPEEAVAFLCAALDSADAPDRDRLIDRAVVVRTAAAWRWLSRQTSNLILVAATEALAVEGAPDHHVVQPLPLREQPVVGAVVLEPLDRDELEWMLVAAGLSASRAGSLARSSGGRPRALQRLLGHADSPAWATQPPTGTTAMLLVGAWSPANAADRAGVAHLAGADPEALDRVCGDLAALPDAPVRRSGGGWRWRAPSDAWQHLAHLVTARELDRFRELSLGVLSADDPAYDLEISERWAAAVRGGVVKHSSLLRAAVAETLVHLRRVDVLGRGRGLAENVVATTLVVEWKRWASLSSVLPMLAEAAPLVFLDAAERSVRTAGGIGELMRQEGGAFGRSPHVSLLWALEALAWDPQHLPRVCDLLLRLSKQDPGGQLVNRPQRSAIAALRPIRPQTLAPWSARVEIARRMVERHGEDGWSFLVAVLRTTAGGVFFQAHRPRFADLDLESDDLASRDQASRAADSVFDAALALAERSPERLADLFGCFVGLEVEQLEAILDRIESTRAVSSPDAVSAVRPPLREFVAWLSRVEKRSAAADALGARAERVLAETEPDDLVSRHAWVFAARIPLGKEDENWQTRVARLAELRGVAAQAVISAPDPDDALVRFVAGVENPAWFGQALGLVDAEATLLERLLASGRDDARWAGTIAEYVAPHAHKRGLGWTAEVLRNIWSRGRVEIFRRTAARLRPDRELWVAVDAIGEDAARTYWTTIDQLHGLPADACREALLRLAGVARHGAGIEACSDALDNGHLDVADAVETLRRGANDLASLREISSMAAYYVEKLFRRIDAEGPLSLAELAQLEVAYLTVLENTARKAPALGRVLGESPAEFVELLSLIYRSDSPDEPGTPHDAEDQSARENRAHAAYAILDAWLGYPGEGQHDSDRIALEWCTRALELARDCGRGSVCESEVAKVIARMPVGADGIWPSVVARELLESQEYPHLRLSLRIARWNMRGVTSRAVDEGGAQERALRDACLRDAEQVAASWPQAAALLREMADRYEDDGRDHDREAEQFRDP